MYVCKHFDIRELVPKKVYEQRGDKAWLLLDDRALMTLDALRNRYGPIVVNSWHAGGDSQWRGLRTPDSPYYSPYSQHTFGRAFDCLFVHYAAEEVRQDILAAPEKWPHIHAMEKDVSWLHFDVRNCKPIMLFSK